MSDNELWLDVSAYKTQSAPSTKTKGRLPVRKAWLEKSIATLNDSIEEAIGRYEDNKPLKNPKNSKNWAPSKSPSKAGPDDMVKVWATCGASIKISLSKEESQTVIQVPGREVVGMLRKMKDIFESPNFENSEVGKRFAETAKEASKPKKMKDGFKAVWSETTGRWTTVK
jgi:hypothetical protein